MEEKLEVTFENINTTYMKIFLSYGHDSNEPLIEKIKDYLQGMRKGIPSMRFVQHGLSR